MTNVRFNAISLNCRLYIAYELDEILTYINFSLVLLYFFFFIPFFTLKGKMVAGEKTKENYQNDLNRTASGFITNNTDILKNGKKIASCYLNSHRIHQTFIFLRLKATDFFPINECRQNIHSRISCARIYL